MNDKKKWLNKSIQITNDFYYLDNSVSGIFNRKKVIIDFHQIQNCWNELSFEKTTACFTSLATAHKYQQPELLEIQFRVEYWSLFSVHFILIFDCTTILIKIDNRKECSFTIITVDERCCMQCNFESMPIHSRKKKIVENRCAYDCIHLINWNVWTRWTAEYTVRVGRKSYWLINHHYLYWN